MHTVHIVCARVALPVIHLGSLRALVFVVFGRVFGVHASLALLFAFFATVHAPVFRLFVCPLCPHPTAHEHV